MDPNLLSILILLVITVLVAGVHYILTDRNWRASIAIGVSVAAGFAVYIFIT